MPEHKLLEKCKISCDKIGQLYFFENRVLRTIYPEKTKEVLEFLNTELFKLIVEKKYFPVTKIVDENIDSCELVIEHDNVLPFSMAYEWTPVKLKQATLQVLELMRMCCKHGYVLSDPHIFNVVNSYKGIYYLDFGSFKKIENVKELAKSYRIFFRNFMLPLMLVNNGRYETARTLFLRRSEFPEHEVYSLLYGSRPVWLKNIMTMFDKLLKKINEVNAKDWKAKGLPIFMANFMETIFTRKDYQTFFEKKTRLLNTLKTVQSSKWRKYQQNAPEQDLGRFDLYLQKLKELGYFSSIVDLACNEGGFAKKCITENVCELVHAVDNDPDALGVLDHFDNKRILTYFSDVVRPDGRHYDDDLRERIKSEVVFALALTHHLYLSQGYPWHTIVDSLTQYTTRFLFVEFMPLGLYDGKEKSKILPNEYSEELFRKEFEKLYNILEVINVAKNRILYLGELKRDC